MQLVRTIYFFSFDFIINDQFQIVDKISLFKQDFIFVNFNMARIKLDY